MKNLYTFLKLILLFLIVMTMSSLNEIPDRSNVLIIGDSISIAYTSYVKDILQERASVSRPMMKDSRAENCQGSKNGVLKLDQWIGDKNWDLIHLDFGLHDLKHVDPHTGKNSPNPRDPLQADPIQYRDNLEKIVKKLQATEAKLIFATTTPYPETAVKPLRDPGMSTTYNNIALEVMAENKIKVNDLYTFVLPRMEPLLKPNNVHFTDYGSKVLGERVADSIRESLLSE